MEIKFFTSKRDANVALWVDYGTGNWNIWDIPASCATPDVLKAIASAFQLGMQAHSFNVTEMLRKAYGDIPKEWEVKEDV